MMKTIIYLKNEWDPKLMRELPEKIELLPLASLEEINFREDALFIAATDSSLKAAKKLNIPACAYANPLFPGQAFCGAKMVIEGFDEIDLPFLEKVYRREKGLPCEIAVTERCIIREFAMEDLPELFKLYENAGEFLEPLSDYKEEEEKERAYIANMYGYYGYGMWLVTDKKTGGIIGRAGLSHREFDGETELELGYFIAPKWQRKGIAAEVCRAIISYAGNNTDFDRINALTDAENTPSLALLNSLNFKLHEEITLNGKNMLRFLANIKFL